MTDTGETSLRDVIGLAYRSYNRAKPLLGHGRDRDIRHPEWTRVLLNQFGAPDRAAYNVLVTGSKGKGSHAILLAGLLEKQGMRVGLFTGPHLVDFMERFRVNGRTMPERDFAEYMQVVADAAEHLPVPETQYIGPVGLLAVVAALWFQDAKTDVNIYECGRGARHDDVNQVVHAGALVAPVFLEHALELGPTVQDVAWEKAGVVTPETQWVVSHRQSPQTLQVLESACRVGAAEVSVLGRDFMVEPVSDSPSTDHETGNVVRVQGRGQAASLLLPAGAGYLAANAAVAWLAAQCVVAQTGGRGPKRSIDAALQTSGRGDAGKQLGDMAPPVIDLTRLHLPGRMQTVREQPLTVVDGTIHAQSARYVRAWLEANRRPGSRVALILAIPHDKDGRGVVQALAAEVDFVIVAQARNPHLTFGPEVMKAALENGLEVLSADDIDEAVALADARLARTDRLLILGTQSFVGDALAAFSAPTQDIWLPSEAEVHES